MSLSKLTTKLSTAWLGLGMALAPAIAFAQTATPPAAAAPVPNKGDIAFMYIATLLVLLMIVPGLALFYGGLMRTKNMLSMLMQVTMIGCVVMIVWAIFGYSMAFGGGTNPFYGGFAKAFMMGMSPSTTSATFTSGVVIPEYLFFLFQMTFAAITPCLIIGAYAERIKFSASVLFCTLWTIFVYFPVAHMVWDSNGFLFKLGALDFAGGTVVHINAGVSGLVGALMVGKRTGFGKEMMAPHSMTMTFIGASLLWVGWFGFNAGSNLEASGGALVATMNTFLATAAATVSWSIVETMTRGKASMLGAASGMVAGLVAVTPASGYAGPMGSIVLGLLVSPLCYFFVSTVKNKFGYDDTADVFGVHGIGGMFGAVITGILASSSLGGVGYAAGMTMGHQIIVQIEAVVTTILWTGIGSLILYKVVDMVVGLRVSVEAEREGLDLASHGEAAYHNS
jgi:Amt family ammonium transporter